jgi:hypothetical protein
MSKLTHKSVLLVPAPKAHMDRWSMLSKTVG